MERLINFDETIDRIKWIYKICGVDINSKHSDKSQKFQLRFIFIFNFLWFNFDVGGAILMFFTGLVRGEDFTILTYIAPCITLSMLSNCKILSLVHYEQHVCDLLDEIRDLEKRCNKEFSLRKLAVVKKQMIFMNRLLKYLNVTYTVLVTTFALSSFIIIGVKYMKTKELELVLPFLIVYPFDPYTLTRWPFVYLHQVWSVSIVTLYVMAADYLFYVCSNYIKIHFLLLQEDFHNLISKRPGGMVRLRADEDFYVRLVELVKRHRILFRSVDRLEVIYGKSTLLNFLSSSLIICLTGFNVTTMYDVTLVITFLSFLFMGLLQIFFLCFYGDMITKSSMGIGDAIFNSQWYSVDVKVMKLLNIIQMRSQKPCKLTAFRFADVNCRAFMRILSTSWSYFALLKTLYSSPKTN